MHGIVIHLIRVQMQKTRYFTINNEVMMIDYHFWCSIHLYVVDGFKRMFLLLNLERVVGGVSQPHFWKSVRMTLTLPKWGLGSPPGLPNLQSWIAGVKTPRIRVFFISFGKLWKCKCRKWARMGHLDICSTS